VLRELILRPDTPLDTDVKEHIAGQLDSAAGRFAAIWHDPGPEQVGDFRSGRTLARSIYPGDQDTIGITPAHRPSLRPSAPGPPFATPAVASEDVAAPRILPHEDDSLGVFCRSP
jgi:hypothetical protein